MEEGIATELIDAGALEALEAVLALAVEFTVFSVFEDAIAAGCCSSNQWAIESSAGFVATIVGESVAIVTDFSWFTNTVATEGGGDAFARFAGLRCCAVAREFALLIRIDDTVATEVACSNLFWLLEGAEVGAAITIENIAIVTLLSFVENAITAHACCWMWWVAEAFCITDEAFWAVGVTETLIVFGTL